MIRTEPELHWIVSGFLWVFFRAMVFAALFKMYYPFELLIALMAVLVFDFLTWLFTRLQKREKDPVSVDTPVSR